MGHIGGKELCHPRPDLFPGEGAGSVAQQRFVVVQLRVHENDVIRLSAAKASFALRTYVFGDIRNLIHEGTFDDKRIRAVVCPFDKAETFERGLGILQHVH